MQVPRMVPKGFTVVFKTLREQGVNTTTNFSTFHPSHLIQEDVLSIQGYIFQQV